MIPPALSAYVRWLALGALLLATAGTIAAQKPAEAPAGAAAASPVAPDEVAPYRNWLPEEDTRKTGVAFDGYLLLDSRGASYRDPIRVNRLVDEIGRSPFPNVVIQVRAFGDAYYASALVPHALGVSAAFDPLDQVLKGLKAGKKAKKVYAWIELYRVANVNRAIPLPPDHILKQHPEWLSRNSKFGTEDAAGNQYLELGLDPVQEYLEEVIVELLEKYPLDGIVLDGLRYPDLKGEWGYHPDILDIWRKETGKTDPPAPDDPAWVKLRRKLVERSLHRFQLRARGARDGARVLAMVSSEGPAPAKMEEFEVGPVAMGALQDWPAWMEQKYADALILMNYRQEGTDSAEFDAWNQFAVDLVQKTGVEVYPAVAGFANISIDSLTQMRRVQDLGLAGAALSNYLEPVRDSASRELFFRALAKTVFAPDSERLAFLPKEELELPAPAAEETEVAGLLPDDMEMELPPPPELEPFDSAPELAPPSPGAVPAEREPEEEEPRVASLLDEASEKLAPKRDGLIEPPFQAVEYLRRKFPNIF